jgi:hypothetical protein
MKKILSVLLALVLLMSLPVSALTSPAPASLPFELTAPGNVSATWLEGGDSPTTIALAYSLNNEMTAFFRAREEASVNGKLEEFMKPYGIGDIGITTQVDWAVDDVDDPVSGWHYTEYWDANDLYSLGYDDEGRCRVGEWDGVDLWVGNWTETVNNHWVLRGVNEDSVNGNPEEGRPGLKDQMHPDQYSWNGEDLRIDFAQHTVYLRMRFLVTTSKETEDGLKNTYYYSDWSNVAAVGKDAEKFEPLKPGDIAAPVIADLHMTDKEFNGNPVVAFTLTVPDELMAGAARVAANGGVIWIQTYCRVKGDAEWTEMQNTDHDIKAGEMECPLLHLVNGERPSISKDTEIELRCRYYISQPGQDDFCSDYSQIIAFGTNDINQGGGTAAPETVPAATDPAVPPSGSSCPICHFCPQPLGLCIFIWLLIIIIVAVVLILVKKGKKKDKK